MIKVYYNGRCSKCRMCAQYLKDKNIEFETIEYLKEPLTKDEIKALFKKLNVPAFEMVRTHEDLYKEQYKGQNLTDEEWIDIFVKEPKLLKRPIVETEDKAIWAVPAEKVDELF